jgi:hypothetical protein
VAASPRTPSEGRAETRDARIFRFFCRRGKNSHPLRPPENRRPGRRRPFRRAPLVGVPRTLYGGWKRNLVFLSAGKIFTLIKCPFILYLFSLEKKFPPFSTAEKLAPLVNEPLHLLRGAGEKLGPSHFCIFFFTEKLFTIIDGVKSAPQLAAPASTRPCRRQNDCRIHRALKIQ